MGTYKLALPISRDHLPQGEYQLQAFWGKIEEGKKYGIKYLRK
jgi:hypothetical protein